jgi:hypothetical protein
VNVPLWATDLAAAFWEAAGGPEPFPRALRGPVARGGLDLTVRDEPGLRSDGVRRYLLGLDIPWTRAGADRRLRACLAARDGVTVPRLASVGQVTPPCPQPVPDSVSSFHPCVRRDSFLSASPPLSKPTGPRHPKSGPGRLS